MVKVNVDDAMEDYEGGPPTDLELLAEDVLDDGREVVYYLDRAEIRRRMDSLAEIMNENKALHQGVRESYNEMIALLKGQVAAAEERYAAVQASNEVLKGAVKSVLSAAEASTSMGEEVNTTARDVISFHEKVVGRIWIALAVLYVLVIFGVLVAILVAKGVM